MIYFVESFPGGGKSYYSRKHFRKAEKKTIYFKEEYHNPLDLLRQAVLSKEEYENFLLEIQDLCNNEAEYIDIKERISKEITVLEDKVFIAFLHIESSNVNVREKILNLYNYEYDDGFVPCREYCDTIMMRLKQFLESKDPDVDYIFEGALFYNPLVTILGFFDMGKDEIVAYYRKLFYLLRSYEYEIDIIRVDDIDKAIRITAQNRLMAGNSTWEIGFERWFDQTKNYSKLRGIEGIISFARDIEEYENMLLKEIPFNKKIIERRL